MLKRYRGFGSNFLWPLVVLTIAFGAFYLKPWQTKPKETISVSATGRAQVTPNIAKVSATIESKNPNLDIARRENEQKVTAIVVKLKELGIDEKDIKTQYISAGPGYEPQTLIYPPRPNTNQIATMLEVTIRSLTNSDEVLASLTQNGATNLYGPNLTVDDATLEQAKSRAREDAVTSAQNNAGELAKLSQRKLDKAVKITEQEDYGLPIPIYARSEVELQEKASLIQPGQNEVTITLQVDFALK